MKALALNLALALTAGCANFGRTPATQGWTVMNFCPRDGTPMHIAAQAAIQATAQHPYGGMEQLWQCATDLPDEFLITNYYKARVK